jgi:predicted AAA+ superfamily ATPase
MKDLIINILQRQKADKIELLKASSIPREAASALVNSLKHKLIKAVIGPRRSGKSSLIHRVLTESKESYAYLNFEDEQIPEGIEFSVIEEALLQVYPKASLYFFDEIQGYPRWEQLLNRLGRSGKRIVISGSNSKLLGSELASSLTGRHELFEVLPFSFGEFRSAHSEVHDTALLLKKYLQTGGFPDVVMNRVNQLNYLRELWDSIILKDVVQRYKVRTVTELKALMSIFRDSFSAPLSNRSLERALQNRLSIATIGKFLGYGQGAYLTFMLQNFSFKSRQRVSADKKAYIVDNGFYSSMKAGAQDDFGRLLENVIFVHLLRQGLKPNLDFFYYKTKSGKEVDFLVLRNGAPKQLIQVSWNLGGQKTLDRELNSLVEAATELNVNDLAVISSQESATHTRANISIKVVPVAEYLDSGLKER